MIEVGLYKSKALVSRLIRWQTRGEYSHAALHFYGDTAIEAWHKGGVQIGAVGQLHDKGTKIDIFHINKFFLEDVTQVFAEAQVGKGYDFRMVARFLTRQSEARGSDAVWFCSELVFEALLKGGCELFKNTKGWEVSPDLLKRSPHLSYDRTIVV